MLYTGKIRSGGTNFLAPGTQKITLVRREVGIGGFGRGGHRRGRGAALGVGQGFEEGAGFQAGVFRAATPGRPKKKPR